jgi:hypothetical protein
MITKEVIETVTDYMIKRYEQALMDKLITQEQHDEWVESVMSWARTTMQLIPPVIH